MRKETFSQSHTRMWLDHEDLHGESFHQSRPSATMAIRKRYFFDPFLYKYMPITSRDGLKFYLTVAQYEKTSNSCSKIMDLNVALFFSFGC